MELGNNLFRQNLIMGVLNVTPDSFSDGGHFLSTPAALYHARQMLAQGCDIIDVGAESSRPGSLRVSVSEEWQRLEPVLLALCNDGLAHRISVDTTKPEIMRQVLKLGIRMINCIDGIKAPLDDDLFREIAASGGVYIAMHMEGTPDTMQEHPLDKYQAIKAIDAFCRETITKLTSCGFKKEQIWIDPGIGFGKDDSGNAALIQWALKSSNEYQVVLGVSRKSFIGRTLNIMNPRSRDDATKMLEFGCMCTGVKAIRTHDVKRLHQLRKLLPL